MGQGRREGVRRRVGLLGLMPPPPPPPPPLEYWRFSRARVERRRDSWRDMARMLRPLSASLRPQVWWSEEVEDEDSSAMKSEFQPSRSASGCPLL